MFIPSLWELCESSSDWGVGDIVGSDSRKVMWFCFHFRWMFTNVLGAQESSAKPLFKRFYRREDPEFWRQKSQMLPDVAAHTFKPSTLETVNLRPASSTQSFSGQLELANNKTTKTKNKAK